LTMAKKNLIPWRKGRGGEGRAGLPAREEPRELFREMFEDFFRPWALAPWRLLGRELELSPAVDVTETDAEYKVSAELPGLTRDDIEVTLQEGRLTISGQKKEETREEKQSYLRVERSYGSFSRTIPLPSSVQEDAVEATFRDGVLSILLPKTAQARGKKVQIKGG